MKFYSALLTLGNNVHKRTSKCCRNYDFFDYSRSYC